MSTMLTNWCQALCQNLWCGDVPALPLARDMALYALAGWSVVLAWLAATVLARWGWGRWAGVPAQRFAAVAMVLAVCLAGPGGLAFWLGLAFQSPSLSMCLLCAVLLWRRLGPQAHGGHAEQDAMAQRTRTYFAGLAAVLGWALLLDTYALLPVQLYALGFSPAMGAVLWLLVALPWVLWRKLGAQGWVVGCALLLFVALRLPSGNVWDAVLDPWLWLAAQVWLVRSTWNCYKKRS